GGIEIFRAVLGHCWFNISAQSLLMVKPFAHCRPIPAAPQWIAPGEKWVAILIRFQRSTKTIPPKVRSDQRVERVVLYEKRGFAGQRHRMQGNAALPAHVSLPISSQLSRSGPRAGLLCRQKATVPVTVSINAVSLVSATTRRFSNSHTNPV